MKPMRTIGLSLGLILVVSLAIGGILKIRSEKAEKAEWGVAKSIAAQKQTVIPYGSEGQLITAPAGEAPVTIIENKIINTPSEGGSGDILLPIVAGAAAGYLAGQAGSGDGGDTIIINPPGGAVPPPAGGEDEIGPIVNGRPEPIPEPLPGPVDEDPVPGGGEQPAPVPEVPPDGGMPRIPVGGFVRPPANPADNNKPDLIISDISISRERIPFFGGADIAFTVQNVGQTAVKDPIVCYPSFSPSVVPVDCFIIQDGLKPGEKKSGSFIIDRNTSWPVGKYTFSVKVDRDNAIQESDKSNNTSRVISFEIVVSSSCPNLTIRDISIDKERIKYGDLNGAVITFKVKNLSATGRREPIVCHPNISPSPVDVGCITIQEGIMFGDVARSFRVGEGKEWPVGSYTATVTVDSDNTIAEYNEDDNTSPIVRFTIFGEQSVAPVVVKPKFPVKGIGVTKPKAPIVYKPVVPVKKINVIKPVNFKKISPTTSTSSTTSKTKTYAPSVLKLSH